MLPEAMERADLEVIDKPGPLSFDADGNIRSPLLSGR
jgi:hypothetical protein